MIKLDGAQLAKEKLTQLQAISAGLKHTPNLHIISVGDDPASKIYIQKKLQLAHKAGFSAHHIKLPETTSQIQLHNALKTSSNDPLTHGILLQLPLPKHLQSAQALEHIHPHKDVDCLHPINIGRLQMNTPLILPCTPKGILSLLDHYQIPIHQQRVAILGRSQIVGLPLSLAMLHRGATVTIIHRDTTDKDNIVKHADIVVTATGQIDVISTLLFKHGSVLVDVGINRSPEGLRGDIAFKDLPSHLKAYTPVPFGVGPMTVISLMENLLELYQKSL